jgi:hypothetical protein
VKLTRSQLHAVVECAVVEGYSRMTLNDSIYSPDWNGQCWNLFSEDVELLKTWLSWWRKIK